MDIEFQRNWIYREYEDVYIKRFGLKPTAEEREVLYKVSNTQVFAFSKKIYYNRLYELLSFYPRWYVKLGVKKDIKNFMKKEKASENLFIIYPTMADILYYNILKASCRNITKKELDKMSI